jgi:hypothetical protein
MSRHIADDGFCEPVLAGKERMMVLLLVLAILALLLFSGLGVFVAKLFFIGVLVCVILMVAAALGFTRRA